MRYKGIVEDDYFGALECRYESVPIAMDIFVIVKALILIIVTV